MSEIKERNNRCSNPGCRIEVFENGEKCILHCEKDDWFVIDEKGNKDWRQSEDKIKEFWRVVYNLWGRGKSLKKVFFPPIDDSDKLSNNEGSDLRTKKGILFEFEKFIKISNSTFLGDFRLNYKFKFEGILFDEETKFLGDLEINNVTIGIKLQFINVTFSKRCSFIMLNDIMLEFFNTTFTGILNFQSLINLKKLEIANSPKIEKICILKCIINSVNICNNKVFNEIEIVNSTINDHLKLSNRRINILSFKGKCNFNTVTVKGKLSKQMYFEDCNFDDDFSIEDFRLICSIVFKSISFSKDCDVYINENSIANFEIANLMNDSNYFTISNCRFCSKVVFINGNFSNLEFYNCAFEKSIIFIKNVAFISNTGFTIFNDLKWPEYNDFVKESTHNEDDKDYIVKSNRDTFRQLKYVNEKQGNIIEANKFYSAEMKAYKEEIKDEKNKTHWQDKFLFCVNWKVSKFSQNWLKPLGWFFLLGFIAFVVSNLCKILSYLNDTSKITLTTIWNAFNQFFEYLNPFNTSPIGTTIIWFGFKVLSVFFIYQFIISLRRQTRR